jgi:hypothetical protein
LQLYDENAEEGSYGRLRADRELPLSSVLARSLDSPYRIVVFPQGCEKSGHGAGCAKRAAN